MREQRILVVDDDDAIRTLVWRLLDRRGLSVDIARNGEEALARLDEQRYGLIILDLMMPRMNGHQLLDRLAALPPANTRPMVLVLTAGLDLRPFDTQLVVGTIHKPFDIELLVDAVWACLASGRDQSHPDSGSSLNDLTHREET